MAKDKKGKVLAAHARGTVYSELLADRILERIAKGEPLASICRTDGFPTPSTIAEWYVYPDEVARPGFAARFQRAERIGLHIMAEDMLNIADDSGKDTVTKFFRGKRVKVVDTENINRDRLRVQTRQFILSKKLREVYGEEIKHEHTGSIDLVARLNAGRQRAEESRRQIEESEVVIDVKAEVVDRDDV